MPAFIRRIGAPADRSSWSAPYFVDNQFFCPNVAMESIGPISRGKKKLRKAMAAISWVKAFLLPFCWQVFREKEGANPLLDFLSFPFGGAF